MPGICHTCAGSSPRLRGARMGNGNGQHSDGIIPASAGSTGRPCARRFQRRDHPRVCGEHICGCGRTTDNPGSSPRLRGAQEERQDRDGGHGIIPASAGSTLARYKRSQRPRDHPRVCGEHTISDGALSGAEGSSPRLRGAPHTIVCATAATRIIPASAGSTPRTGPPVASARDHPRVCGEHPGSTIVSTAFLGSSPRLRGARARLPKLLELPGIIPASAGST